MANSKEVADLIAQGMRPPSGPRDLEMYTGVVLAWDTLTGENTILVNGTEMPDLRCLTSGIGVRFTVGETVVVIKKQTQYFILGRVSAPQSTSGIRSDTNNMIQVFGTGGAWADAPGFPNDPQVQVYIGASQTCLVMYQARISVSVGDPTFGADIYDPTCLAAVSFAVSGASTIAPDTYVGQAALLECQFWNASSTQNVVPLVSVSGFMVLDGSRGLNSGLNTFTMKYKTAQTAGFHTPSLVVIPL